jgi:hypothetical protein
MHLSLNVLVWAVPLTFDPKIPTQELLLPRTYKNLFLALLIYIQRLCTNCMLLKESERMLMNGKAGLHKYRTARRTGDNILYGGACYFPVLSMERALHPSGA